MVKSSVGVGIGGGAAGGGAGFTLGPETNEFGTSSTANKAAAQTLRNTYASANAAWLAEYNDNVDFLIELNWTGGQRRLPAPERRRRRLGGRERAHPRREGGQRRHRVSGVATGSQGATGSHRGDRRSYRCDVETTGGVRSYQWHSGNSGCPVVSRVTRRAQRGAALTLRRIPPATTVRT